MCNGGERRPHCFSHKEVNAMGRNKRLGLLVLAVAMMAMSSLACGGEVSQDTATEIAGNEDDQLVSLSNAVTEEADALSEACQLGALWRQVGDNNKITFLAKINDGCWEAGMGTEWAEAWDGVSPNVSWVEYLADN